MTVIRYITNPRDYLAKTMICLSEDKQVIIKIHYSQNDNSGVLYGLTSIAESWQDFLKTPLSANLEKYQPGTTIEFDNKNLYSYHAILRLEEIAVDVKKTLSVKSARK
ncbi:MAG: hypothetical protein CMM93_06005 [Rickettsiales bacterium]|nr:hypothetical protein [Rickettsiales bacterium]